MMYQAWIRPGINPSTQSAILMMESAVQIPDLIHTVSVDRHDQHSVKDREARVGGLPAMGGKKTASTARKISELHMAPRMGLLWAITCKRQEESLSVKDD